MDEQDAQYESGALSHLFVGLQVHRASVGHKGTLRQVLEVWVSSHLQRNGDSEPRSTITGCRVSHNPTNKGPNLCCNLALHAHCVLWVDLWQPQKQTVSPAASPPPLALRLYLGSLQWDLGILKEWHHCIHFAGEENQQAVALVAVASSAAHAVDVGSRVLWAVQLHHPVNPWKVQASGSDIRRKQHSGRLLQLQAAV